MDVEAPSRLSLCNNAIPTAHEYVLQRRLRNTLFLIGVPKHFGVHADSNSWRSIRSKKRAVVRRFLFQNDGERERSVHDGKCRKIMDAAAVPERTRATNLYFVWENADTDAMRP